MKSRLQATKSTAGGFALGAGLIGLPAMFWMMQMEGQIRLLQLQVKHGADPELAETVNAIGWGVTSFSVFLVVCLLLPVVRSVIATFLGARSASAVASTADRQPLQKFPFGRARRIMIPPLYAGLMLADR